MKPNVQREPLMGTPVSQPQAKVAKLTESVSKGAKVEGESQVSGGSGGGFGPGLASGGPAVDLDGAGPGSSGLGPAAVGDGGSPGLPPGRPL